MIREKIKAIKQSLATAKLVVVSKHRSIEELQEVYEAGERCFAENRVQELLKKAPLLPSDVEWHLIGHLQTNKVKQILPLVSLIHSVDRVSLLDAIEKEASKLDRTISVLLQVHLAQEESKFGFNPGELVTLIKSGGLNKYAHIRFTGVMCMASFVENSEIIRAEFEKCKEIFTTIQPFMPDPKIFIERSMGMSSDYQIALKSGATMVRIGSKIFA